MSVQPDRRAMLAKIHIAKKQMAMEEDSYRAMLLRVTGQASSATCTPAQLEAVIAEFKRLGFSAEPAKPKRSDKAYVRMIYGIWGDLRPYLNDHSHTALRSFTRRQTGQDAPEFLNPEDANLVIEGLKAWLAREQHKRAAEKQAGKKYPKLRRRPAGLPPVRVRPPGTKPG